MGGKCAALKWKNGSASLKWKNEKMIVLWVRPRWVYGWDTNTCMGETPTPVWVRHLDSRGRANGEWQDRFSANPNGAPWVIWNRIGWKCVMLRVISNEELGKMRLSECRGQTCLNYAEHEHLRRSQLGVAMLDTGRTYFNRSFVFGLELGF